MSVIVPPAHLPTAVGEWCGDYPSEILILATVRVIGDPKPQGSKAAFKARSGAVINKESGGVAFARWRNAVALAASEERARREIGVTGPVEMHALYRSAMPQSRRKADRERGWCWQTTQPDLDKLERAVGDGLQASGLLANDSLIVHNDTRKIEVWQAWTGVLIVLTRAGYPPHTTDLIDLP